MRPLPITEIEWDAGDALPFPLCVSVKERPGLEISVALGNIVLVDHGADGARRGARHRAGSATRRRAPAAAGACSCEHARCANRSRCASVRRWLTAPVS